MNAQTNEQLEKLVDALPMIQKLFSQDVYIMVVDTNRIVYGYAIPEGKKPLVEVGEIYQDPTGVLNEVLKTRKAMHNRLPKEVMGESFEGQLVPIMDGGNIVGCIICTYSVDMKVQMTAITEKFRDSVSDIQDSLQELLGGIESLFNILKNMDEITSNVENDVKNAVDVVNVISSNASRSNILALNASIEAARSGEYGRGFAVVAGEMGKLANDSGKSSSEIKATLNNIMEHLNTIISSIKNAGQFAKEYSGNIRSIQDVLKNTINLAGELEEDINQQ